MKILLFLLFTISQSFCVTSSELIGKWTAYSESRNHSTLTTEKEFLSLNADGTFSVKLLVSVKNGDAFIKDLHIEASGLWKNRDETLVIFIKNLKIPFAKEIYRISKSSLRQVASVFENRYKDAQLKIINIQNFTGKSLVTLNEKKVTTTYTKQ